MSSADISPTGAPIYGMAGSCGSYFDLRMHFSKKPSGNFEKQDLLLTGLGGYTVHLRATQQGHRLGGMRGESTYKSRPGALPLLGSEGGVSRVSWIHSVLANFKRKSGKWDAGREEQGHSGGQLSSYPGLSEKGTFTGGGHLIHYPVVLLVAVSYSWQCFIQDGCHLKWMPRQLKA